MKVLILGGQGMLGHKLIQIFQPHVDVFATFRALTGLWQNLPLPIDQSKMVGGVDALKLATVEQVLEQVQPDVVINCIGIIKQLKEAHDPILSIETNSLFPHRLAEQCRKYESRLITISTDCVFSGEKGSYSEADTPDPVDLYGRTKLLGELHYKSTLTLRTSLIGRDYLKNTGLIEWFYAQEGQTIKGFTNAIYSGLTTEALANNILEIIQKHPSLQGVYHLASAPINKYDLLTKLRNIANLDIEISPDGNLKCDRSLDATRYRAATGYEQPSWEKMLQKLADEATHYTEWRKEQGLV